MSKQQNKNIGLFFGSFNPVHVGHVMIANYMIEFEGMDEVWFIISPQNPFKSKSGLMPQEHRLTMVENAVKDLKNIKASNIEFSMPRPSYTINTLRKLKELHPGMNFHILMGADNIINVHRWKEAETIITNYPLLVYPRNGYTIEQERLPAGTRITNAPIVDISSTMLRDWITSGHDVKAFMPAGTYEYIIKNSLL